MPFLMNILSLCCLRRTRNIALKNSCQHTHCGGRVIKQILEKTAPASFVSPVAELVLQYMVPSNKILRNEFATFKRCSPQTLHDLDHAGCYLREIDLSHIALGILQPRTDTYTIASDLVQMDSQILIDIFKRCRYLEKLNLAECHINDTAVTLIAPYLSRIHTLDLSGNKALSFISMREIAKITTLQHLSLRNMVDSDDDRNTNICFYHLLPKQDWNTPHEERGIAFLRALSSLITLDLSGNELASGGEWCTQTDIRLHSCIPDLIKIIEQVGSLRTLILNQCVSLTQTHVEELRATRAAIEVISNAT